MGCSSEADRRNGGCYPVASWVVHDRAEDTPVRSLRDSRRPYLPALQTPLQAIYWGAAVVSGLILAFPLLGWPGDFFILIAIGVGATLIGWRVEGGVSNHRPTSWLWGGIAMLVWLPLAFLLHTFPFGR